MQSAKNVTASAKAGMDKTKATVQEKAEKMTTRDPLQKELATEKKEEKIHRAELQKQQARAQPTTGDIRQNHPQGMGGEMDYPEGGTAGLGSGGGVEPIDPNVAGGARTGYGPGNTI